MAIIDPAAIKYSNEQFRPAADRMARCYYRSLELSDAWPQAGPDNDTRFAMLKPDIVKVANLISNTFRFIWWSDQLWNAGSLHLLFPNDAAEEIHDAPGGGAQDPNRPPLTGQDVRRLKNRMEEFNNYLSRGTDIDKGWTNDGTATLPVTYDYFHDCVRMSQDGAKVQTTNDGRTVAVDRCGDIVTEWQDTNPGNFGHILKASVNPGETPL